MAVAVSAALPGHCQSGNSIEACARADWWPVWPLRAWMAGSVSASFFISIVFALISSSNLPLQNRRPGRPVVEHN